MLPKVRPIVQAVAERGAEAALDFGESFDGVRPRPCGYRIARWTPR
ncbi:NAD oxidoreductase [Mycobacterium kansasii]|uniref:NAD oxidoreductase n=1 Tax=Mycobacterium kansasii TaxID=1768 RepID=A0A1V3WHW8_MYCKA|nr:NAD oxidoreductase [Mycobacterium kansasii]